MSGGTSRETTGSFSVPAPTFSVNTPSAHTNYDTYYNNGKYNNADAANAEDGSTIFGVKDNGVCISKDILTNPKYASLIGKYSFTIDDKNAEAGDHANQTWGEHKVVAKFTFDGVEKTSDALTCYVTGLPFAHTQTPYNQWQVYRSASISGSEVKLPGAASVNDAGYILSPKIVSPKPINVSLALKAKSDQLASTSIMNLYYGTTQNPNSPSQEKSFTTSKSAQDFSGNISVDNAHISFLAGGIRNRNITISSMTIQYN